MTRDFTYDIYRDLLRAATESGYAVLTVREYLSRDSLPERFVVKRHDVDRKPGNALDFARLEADLGVSSTYYFRTIDKTFEPDMIEEIADLGHEIGYHYEDLDRAEGDVAAAHDSFRAHLDRLRDVATVETICMHGNPLTPYDNREMWKEGTLDEYDLLGEAYLSVDFTDVTYFTDTNRTWYDEKTMANDWPDGPSEKAIQVQTTRELIGLVESRRADRLYVLSHPNRWADTLPELVAETSKDAVTDVGKWGLWMLDRARGWPYERFKETVGQRQ